MRFLIHLFALASVLVMLGAESTARAAVEQDSDDAEQGAGAERELGQHRFVIPAELDHAFLVTSLSLDQGFGSMKVRRANVDGELLVLRERFRFQLGLGSRIALQAGVDARAGVADDADTLLAVAGIANMEFTVGPKARLLTESELGLQVSAGLDFKPTLSHAVSPAPLAAGASSHVLERRDVSFIQPGLMAAWGHGVLGLQLDVRPAITTNARKSPSIVQAGAALGFDFSSTSRGSPFALAIEYDLEKRLDDGAAVHGLTSGAFYSAKRELQLGLRYSAVFGMPGSSLRSGTLNLGYFF